jgi:hypothetical protein
MLQKQKSIWNFVQQFGGSQFGKVGIALVLGLLFLGATFGANTSQAHAQVRTSGQASQPAQSTSSNIAMTPNGAKASDITSMIYQVFGPYGAQAVRIATCESTLNPNATNSQYIGNSRAAGLFQILYPSTWYGTSQAARSPYDAYANTVAAHEIFVRDGYSWREWECHL